MAAAQTDPSGVSSERHYLARLATTEDVQQAPWEGSSGNSVRRPAASDSLEPNERAERGTLLQI